MATIEQRYQAATSYVQRAIAFVEHVQVYDPFSAAIEWYAGSIKTEPYRNELARIETRWLRATNDIDRARVARDAELLADRTEETLPGAPQTWTRTNLWPGEKPTSTPATSYAQSLSDEAANDWQWVTSKAEEAKGFGSWLLLGGAMILSFKLVDYLNKREQRRQAPNARALNRRLARLAAERERGGGWR